MARKKQRGSHGRLPDTHNNDRPPPVPPQPSPPLSLHLNDDSNSTVNQPPRRVQAASSARSIVHLDGTILEGGGQLVRVALCLSALLSVPVHITRIRGNRAHRSGSGGLKESHMAALDFLARYSGAQVDGAKVGSSEVTFIPGSTPAAEATQVPLEATIRLEKPGSVFLILQAILPFILFGRNFRQQPDQISDPASSTPADRSPDNSVPKSPRVFILRLHGGTNVPQSMSGEYVQQVLLPTLEQMGLPRVKVEIVRRGWAGSASEIGEVTVQIPITDTPPLSSTDDDLTEVYVQPQPSFTVSPPIPPTLAPDRRLSLQRITTTIVASPPNSIDLFSLQSDLTSNLHHSFPLPDLKVEPIESADSHDPRRLYILLVAHVDSDPTHPPTGVHSYPVPFPILSSDYLAPGRSPRTPSEYQRIWKVAVDNVVGKLRHEIDRATTSALSGGGYIDPYLEDQLVIFHCLAHHYRSVGNSRVSTNNMTSGGGTTKSSDGDSNNSSEFVTSNNNKTKNKDSDRMTELPRTGGSGTIHTTKDANVQTDDSPSIAITNTADYIYDGSIPDTSAHKTNHTASSTIDEIRSDRKTIHLPVRSAPVSWLPSSTTPTTTATLHTQTARWVCERMTGRPMDT